MNTPHTAAHENLLHRICAEYLEMPGLRLTLHQALRLWGLDERTCTEALDALLESKFLSQRIDGTYARSSDGPDGASRFPILRADFTIEATSRSQRPLRRQES